MKEELMKKIEYINQQLFLDLGFKVSHITSAQFPDVGAYDEHVAICVDQLITSEFILSSIPMEDTVKPKHVTIWFQNSDEEHLFINYFFTFHKNDKWSILRECDHDQVLCILKGSVLSIGNHNMDNAEFVDEFVRNDMDHLFVLVDSW